MNGYDANIFEADSDVFPGTESSYENDKVFDANSENFPDQVLVQND